MMDQMQLMSTTKQVLQVSFSSHIWPYQLISLKIAGSQIIKHKGKQMHWRYCLIVKKYQKNVKLLNTDVGFCWKCNRHITDLENLQVYTPCNAYNFRELVMFRFQRLSTSG